MGEEIFDGDGVGETLLHQFYGRVGELVGGLEEVARVCPEESAVGGYDESAGRACESAEPAAHLPVVGNIFAVMGVGLGDDSGVDVGLCHLISERFEALGNDLFHDVNINSVMRMQI